MKTLITITLLLMINAGLASARIGDTMKQCIARYGKPMPITTPSLTIFKLNNITVGVKIYRGKVCAISYIKDGKFSDAQLHYIMKLNSTKKWTQMRGEVPRRYTTSNYERDNTALMCGLAFEGNMITIGTKAALIRESKEKVKELDGL